MKVAAPSERRFPRCSTARTVSPIASGFRKLPAKDVPECGGNLRFAAEAVRRVGGTGTSVSSCLSSPLREMSAGRRSSSIPHTPSGPSRADRRRPPSRRRGRLEIRGRRRHPPAAPDCRASHPLPTLRLRWCFPRLSGRLVGDPQLHLDFFLGVRHVDRAAGGEDRFCGNRGLSLDHLDSEYSRGLGFFSHAAPGRASPHHASTKRPANDARPSTRLQAPNPGMEIPRVALMAEKRSFGKPRRLSFARKSWTRSVEAAAAEKPRTIPPAIAGRITKRVPAAHRGVQPIQHSHILVVEVDVDVAVELPSAEKSWLCVAGWVAARSRRTSPTFSPEALTSFSPPTEARSTGWNLDRRHRPCSLAPSRRRRRTPRSRGTRPSPRRGSRRGRASRSGTRGRGGP